MIAHNTLRLLSPSAPDNEPLLTLAPFGVEAMETVMPLDLTGLLMSEGQLTTLAEETAEGIAANYQSHERTVTWGIYEHEPSLQNFLGTVSLSEYDTGTPEDPHYTRVAQDVGTFIMNRSIRGRGLGTLAKLTVIEHQLASPETKIFQARTTEANTPAQRSLHKLGFDFLTDWMDDSFATAGPQQYWQLIREESIERAAEDAKDRERLLASWQRYVDFRGDRHVVETLENSDSELVT